MLDFSGFKITGVPILTLPWAQLYINSCNVSLLFFRGIESSLYRHRRRLQPKIPQTIQEFIGLLDSSGYGQYYKGSIQLGENFAVIFVPDTMKEVLNECQEISFDGTFFCCPALFSHIFTVFGVKEDKTFPCATVLMTAKTQELYEAVFRKIVQIAPEFSPVIAISDFEIASRNAVKSIFPDIRVSGCAFHFMQAILRMSKKQGLTNAFKSNRPF